MVDTGIWPLCVCGSHGHIAKIADQVADNEIAAAWYQDLDKEELGDAAAYHGTWRISASSLL